MNQQIHTGLKEAVAEQYIFLAVNLEAEAGQRRKIDDEDWPAFVQDGVVHLYEKWLKGQAPPCCQLPRDLCQRNERQGRGYRVYPLHGESNWERGQDPNRRGFFRSCLLNKDIFLLHLGLGQLGTAPQEIWKILENNLWAPSRIYDSPFYLGQTVCFGGRSSIEEEKIRDLAHLALPGIAGEHGQIRCAKLPLGWQGGFGWLCDRPGLLDKMAFYYPDNDEAENDASGWYNEWLPGLAGHLHQIAHQYGRKYEGRLKEDLEERERKLAGTLQEAGQCVAGTQNSNGKSARGLIDSNHSSARVLESLENHLKDVAAAYGEFAAGLGKFEKIQQSVTVNAASLEEFLCRYNLPSDRGPLVAWKAVVSQAVRQLDADARLFQATTHETEITLRSLQVQTALIRGQEEERQNQLTEDRNRRLAFHGLFFSLIALILAFSGIIDKSDVKSVLQWYSVSPSPEMVFWTRLGLFVVIGAILSTLWFWVVRWFEAFWKNRREMH